MSLFDAELFAAMQFVTSNAAATSSALAEAIRVISATDRDDTRRQLEKVAEFHRLFAVRVASILRSMGDGR
ncbi:MAG: hypothetical protein IAE78_22875 [Myxococcus sp.]|nr:hypothetical protein [Myxococcus sp.]